MQNKYEVRKAKETYLPGVRVRLVKMDDAQAPVVGTEGTVHKTPSFRVHMMHPYFSLAMKERKTNGMTNT